MANKIPEIFSEDALIKDSFKASNELFGDIIEKFSLDHDTNQALGETGLHKMVTLIAHPEGVPPNPQDGEAVLYRSGASELTLADVDGNKNIQRRVIATTIPQLPVAYASFKITNGVVGFNFGENIEASGVTAINGRSIFEVTFLEAVDSDSYKFSGWAIPVQRGVPVNAKISNQTERGFRASFTDASGSGYTTLNLINFTIFF